MIQNTDDIYEIIRSPLYAVTPNSGYKQYYVYNKKAPSDYIRIEIHDTYMEIYKYKNMNSEYYENIATTNDIGRQIAKRFKKILLAKRALAKIKKHTSHVR